MRDPHATRRVDRERPITWAVLEWLQGRGWPLIFTEIQIPRGFVRGRVDVAAASRGFRTSVVVEVKAVYVSGDPEGQVFDAVRAAEHVYLAAPREVVDAMEIPAGVGILVARTDGARATLDLVREAVRGRPEPGPRKDFLHALMRSAARRGSFDPQWAEGNVCPACSSDRCPVWCRPIEFDVVEEQQASQDRRTSSP